MSQSIERSGGSPHNPVTVTLMTRTARPHRTRTGLPTRLVLSALVGLLSLLAVLGLPAEATAFASGPRDETAFEHRPTGEPATRLRIERPAADIDETETHGRLAAAATGPASVGLAAGRRPSSDRSPGEADDVRPERPPRG
ncbi:hypothetical protein [Methylobacterium sp. Leaf118]|uniref:hypothetical protein n=1 Tax=Methylobacterium sp. Leaf118 TaxID=2876562 RepID=UPI001E317BD0|nr:hypothetical protein [Methylobacterium sp. Leaf118]